MAPAEGTQKLGTERLALNACGGGEAKPRQLSKPRAPCSRGRRIGLALWPPSDRQHMGALKNVAWHIKQQWICLSGGSEIFGVIV